MFINLTFRLPVATFIDCEQGGEFFLSVEKVSGDDGEIPFMMETKFFVGSLNAVTYYLRSHRNFSSSPKYVANQVSLIALSSMARSIIIHVEVSLGKIHYML